MKLAAKDKRTLKTVLTNLGFPLITVGVMAAVYAVASAIVGSSLVLPGLGEIFSSIGELLSTADFYKSLAFTLLRSFVAFAAAFVVGGALGMAAFRVKAVERMLSPLMVFLRAVPTMAVIFLLVLWVRSIYAPSVVAFTILMPMSYSQTKTALDSLDKGLFEMSRVYGVPRSRVMGKFVLPQIAPPLVEHSAGDLSFSVKLVVAGEALAQTAHSLGGALNIANAYIETARLLAITLVAVVVCFILEFGVRLIELAFRRWR